LWHRLTKIKRLTPLHKKCRQSQQQLKEKAMHITNLLVKSVLSSALTISSLSIFAAASSEHTGHNEHQHHSRHHAMQNMADDYPQHTETADEASYQPPPKLLHQQQALNTPQNSVSSASEH